MSIKKSLIIVISLLLAIFVVSTVWNFLSWELNKGTPVAPKEEVVIYSKKSFWGPCPKENETACQEDIAIYNTGKLILSRDIYYISKSDIASIENAISNTNIMENNCNIEGLLMDDYYATYNIHSKEIEFPGCKEDLNEIDGVVNKIIDNLDKKNECCEGLRPMMAYDPDTGEQLIGTLFSTCMPCRDGICENSSLENKYNCPVDCNCVIEGKRYNPINEINQDCCSGLKAITPKDILDRGGNISFNLSAEKICSPCGDGICNKYEDGRNCPEDCAENNSKEEIKDNADENKNYLYYFKEEWGSGVSGELSYNTVEEIVIDKDECYKSIDENKSVGENAYTAFIVNHKYKNDSELGKTLQVRAIVSHPWLETLMTFNGNSGIILKPNSEGEVDFRVNANGCYDQAQIEIYDIESEEILESMEITYSLSENKNFVECGDVKCPRNKYCNAMLTANGEVRHLCEDDMKIY